MNTTKSNVLFICTGNSARSLMAEAIANQQFSNSLQAFSAGSQPKGEPHQLAIESIKKNSLTTDGLRSKSWNEFTEQQFDLVVTLCDSARDEVCPSFPGTPPTVHWSLSDPATEATPDAFDSTFEALFESIGFMVNGPNPSLEGRAKEASRELARRFSPKAM